MSAGKFHEFNDELIALLTEAQAVYDEAVPQDQLHSYLELKMWGKGDHAYRFSRQVWVKSADIPLVLEALQEYYRRLDATAEVSKDVSL